MRYALLVPDPSDPVLLASEQRDLQRRLDALLLGRCVCGGEPDLIDGVMYFLHGDTCAARDERVESIVQRVIKKHGRMLRATIVVVDLDGSSSWGRVAAGAQRFAQLRGAS